METVRDFNFLGSKITADGDCRHEIKTPSPWEENYDQPTQHIKKQRHYFAKKGPSRQGYVFSSSHVWMWELDHKEIWAPKNWCFQTVVLEKTLESPLDCKETQPVHPKGHQSWVFIGRTKLKLKPQYLATWCEELTNLKRPWRWERLKAGGEGDDRGCDGWMASLTHWRWVWVNSRSWWWTWRPGMLQSMGLQSWILLSNWTELNWSDAGPLKRQGWGQKSLFKIEMILEEEMTFREAKLILGSYPTFPPRCFLSQIIPLWAASFPNRSLNPISIGLLGGSVVKNPPAMQETWVQSLGQDDPLRKEMATYSSIFVWKIPWTEEPGRLQSIRVQKNQTWLRDKITPIGLQSEVSSLMTFKDYLFYIAVVS